MKNVAATIKSTSPRRVVKKKTPGKVRRGTGVVQNKAGYFKFMDWFAKTSEEKATLGIKTQAEFAAKYGISKDTLVDWKKRDDFRPGVFEQTRKWASDRCPDVIAGLYERAKKGYAMEVELYLLIAQGFTREGAKEAAKILPLSENDIFELARHLPEEKQKQFYASIAELLAEARTNRDTAEPKKPVS